ncbi:MAG: glycosyltransferase, partial [Desulfovibrio sp.]|nr:glycosyltransferase [Desulfovibrio sp.]
MRAHLSLITWNRLDLTRRCLESLLAVTPPGYSLTIADNGSDNETRDYLRALTTRHGHISLKCLARNMGLTVASNLAWDDAGDADVCIKLDNDLEFLDARWLSRLTTLLEAYPRVGMAAYRLCEWHEPSRRPLPLPDGDYAEETTVCGGGCAAIPRATRETLGYWNEGYGRYGHEDQDYSWRAARAGYTLAALDPTGMVAHRGYAPGQVNADMEAAKHQSNEARLSGETAYQLYMLLFDEGLLPLKMGRKYLPRQENGIWRFTLNPAFRPVQRLLNELVK